MKYAELKALNELHQEYNDLANHLNKVRLISTDTDEKNRVVRIGQVGSNESNLVNAKIFDINIFLKEYIGKVEAALTAMSDKIVNIEILNLQTNEKTPDNSTA